MPSVTANGITIEYERSGPDGPPVLMIAGLGSQLHFWPDWMVDGLVDAGFEVIRYDNRDAGRSTRFDGRRSFLMEAVTARAEGRPPPAVPYRLRDMADDGAALLDALGVATAHVVGASMGGYIAQILAATHPHRVRSLTSIMSTTGAADVGQTTEEMTAWLFRSPPTDRDAAIADGIEYAALAHADFYDPERARRRTIADLDRGVYPEGTGRQLAAIVAAGDRTAQVASITVPTLVIHGEKDALIDVSGGRATAAAIHGAAFVVLPGAGHDLPPAHDELVVTALVDHMRSA